MSSLDVEQLYWHYGPSVLRRSVQMVWDATIARQIMIQVLIEALEKSATPNTRPSLSWLYRETTKRAHHQIRSTKNPSASQARELSGAFAQLPSLEVVSALREVVSRSTPRIAEVITYFYLDDLEPFEIAPLIDTSEAEVTEILRAFLAPSADYTPPRSQIAPTLAAYRRRRTPFCLSDLSADRVVLSELLGQRDDVISPITREHARQCPSCASKLQTFRLQVSQLATAASESSSASTAAERAQNDRAQNDRTQNDRTQNDRTQNDRTQSERAQNERDEGWGDSHDTPPGRTARSLKTLFQVGAALIAAAGLSILVLLAPDFFGPDLFGPEENASSASSRDARPFFSIRGTPSVSEAEESTAEIVYTSWLEQYFAAFQLGTRGPVRLVWPNIRPNDESQEPHRVEAGEGLALKPALVVSGEAGSSEKIVGVFCPEKFDLITLEQRLAQISQGEPVLLSPQRLELPRACTIQEVDFEVPTKASKG